MSTDKKVNGPTIITEDELTPSLREMLTKIDCDKLELGTTTNNPDEVVLGGTIVARKDIPDEYLIELSEIEMGRGPETTSLDKPKPRLAARRRSITRSVQRTDTVKVPLDENEISQPPQAPADPRITGKYLSSAGLDIDYGEVVPPPTNPHLPEKQTGIMLAETESASVSEAEPDPSIWSEVEPKTEEVLASQSYDPKTPPVPPKAPPRAWVAEHDDEEFNDNPTTSDRIKLPVGGLLVAQSGATLVPVTEPAPEKEKSKPKFPPIYNVAPEPMGAVGIPADVIAEATVHTQTPPPSPTASKPTIERTLAEMVSIPDPPVAPAKPIVISQARPVKGKQWLNIAIGLILTVTLGNVALAIAVGVGGYALHTFGKQTQPIEPLAVPVRIVDIPPIKNAPPVQPKVAVEIPAPIPPPTLTIERSVLMQSGRTCIYAGLHGLTTTTAGDESIAVCGTGIAVGSGISEGCLENTEKRIICGDDIEKALGQASDPANKEFEVRPGVLVYCSTDEVRPNGKPPCQLNK